MTIDSNHDFDVSIVIVVPDSDRRANISGSYVIVAVYFVPSDKVPVAFVSLIFIVVISGARRRISENVNSTGLFALMVAMPVVPPVPPLVNVFTINAKNIAPNIINAHDAISRLRFGLLFVVGVL